MSTMSKFGVPIAGGQRNGILHPKQNYRFRVRFNNFGLNQLNREMTQNVVSATRPSYSQEITTIDAYNSRAYIAGKHEWAEIEVTLRDDITNAINSAVGEQIQKQVNHFEQTSAVSGSNYKFNMSIDSLDGTNNDEIESWDLEGCFISNVSNPEGDYASSEANLITITIRYDNALHRQGINDNDGTVVGGDPMINLPSPNGGFTIG